MGTKVALFAPNTPEWIIAFLSLIALDAVPVPLDHLLSDRDLKTILADSGCTHIFTTSDLLPAARHAGGRDRIHAFLLDRTESRTEKATGWDKLLQPAKSCGPTPDLPERAPDDTAILFYTSGTTGPPKGVLIPHRAINSNLAAIAELGIVTPRLRALLPLPFHHAYPLLIGVLAPLEAGATIVLPAVVSGPALRDAMSRGKATALVAVPRLLEAFDSVICSSLGTGGAVSRLGFHTLLWLCGELRRRTGINAGKLLFRPVRHRIGPSLGLLVCGGARLEPDVESRLEALGWDVLTGYGLTETAALATFNPPHRRRAGTVGRPMPGVEVRISGAESGGSGEVWLRGPCLFTSYRGRPAATRKAFARNGWFRTGDLGFLDKDGYLHITGRSAEMIVLADGKNIAPEDVEAAYAQSPYVEQIAILERDGALVGLVLPDMDTLRQADIYRIEDALRVSLGAISQHLPTHERISGYAVTRESLPRTRLGKLRRHLLPALYDRAERGGAGPAPVLSAADEFLMGQPRANRVWRWLQERYASRVLTPDTSPQLDLGIDSLGWVEIGLALERELGIRMTEAQLARVVTLRDLLQEAEAAGEMPERKSVAAGAPPDEAWIVPTGVTFVVTGFVLRFLARLLARIFLRLRIDGMSNLADRGPIVLTPNHASDLDAVVLYAALPWRTLRHTFFAADRKRMFSTRFMRLFARIGQAFPIDDRLPEHSVALGRSVLARGDTVVWFPEAWISPDGKLQPFQSGLGALLHDSGATTIPIHIRGTFEAMPRGARFPRPAAVHVRIGKPVGPEALPDSKDPRKRNMAIAALVHEAVAALADNHFEDRDSLMSPAAD